MTAVNNTLSPLLNPPRRDLLQPLLPRSSPPCNPYKGTLHSPSCPLPALPALNALPLPPLPRSPSTLPPSPSHTPFPPSSSTHPRILPCRVAHRGDECPRTRIRVPAKAPKQLPRLAVLPHDLAYPQHRQVEGGAGTHVWTGNKGRRVCQIHVAMRGQVVLPRGLAYPQHCQVEGRAGTGVCKDGCGRRQSERQRSSWQQKEAGREYAGKRVKGILVRASRCLNSISPCGAFACGV